MTSQVNYAAAASGPYGSVEVPGAVLMTLDGSGVPQAVSATAPLPSADVASGAVTDAAATNSTSSWSMIALLKGIWNNTMAFGNLDNTTPAIVTLTDSLSAAIGTLTNPLAFVRGVPGAPWNYAAASGGITTASQVVLAAAAAGKFNQIQRLNLINTGTTATEVTLLDGATVIWRTKLPATMITGVDYDLSGLIVSAGNALNLSVITAAGAVYANAQGFTK